MADFIDLGDGTIYHVCSYICEQMQIEDFISRNLSDEVVKKLKNHKHSCTLDHEAEKCKEYFGLEIKFPTLDIHGEIGRKVLTHFFEEDYDKFRERFISDKLEEKVLNTLKQKRPDVFHIHNYVKDDIERIPDLDSLQRKTLLASLKITYFWNFDEEKMLKNIIFNVISNKSFTYNFCDLQKEIEKIESTDDYSNFIISKITENVGYALEALRNDFNDLKKEISDSFDKYGLKEIWFCSEME